MRYAVRLREDAQRWRELGIIDDIQASQILATAENGGTARMHVALILCAAACASAAAIAFTASNWALMDAGTRLVALLLGNAVAVAGACWARVRQDAAPTPLLGALAEGLSVLSLAMAAAAIALVGQTFHVEPDPRGFALTVATLGAATAIVSRSGGAALLGCVALSLYGFDLDAGILSPRSSASAAGMGFWLVAAAYACLILTGRVRAGAAVSLALLAAVAVQSSGGAWNLLSGGRGLANLVGVAAVGIGAGHALTRLRPDVPWLSRDAGEALSRGAAGLALVGILLLAQNAGGLDGFWGRPRGYVGYAALSWLGLAAVALALPRFLGKGTLPVGHMTVLGALAFSLLAYVLSMPATLGAKPGVQAIGSAAVVWVGILPALALVVAGHLEERRALFWWSIVATAGLSVWLLASSSNLAGLALNLMGLATVFVLSVLAGRLLSRRMSEVTP